MAGTNNVMMIPVPDRTADTLLDLIIDWIAPGSRILTDGWAAYRRINQLTVSECIKEGSG